MFVEHKEVGEVTEAPAKTLKLSEAIREGAKRYPVHERKYFFGEGGGRCAIAAAAGVTGMYICEMMRHYAVPADVEIGIYNRNRLQSREDVADWLEAQGY